MVFERVRTIQDLEKLYYSDRGIMLLSEDDLRAPFITKADDPVMSTTTGVYNAIYGAEIWYQLNTEANLFGAIPKVPWGRSGWRVMTGRPSSGGAVGVAETARPSAPEPQQTQTEPDDRDLALKVARGEVKMSFEDIERMKLDMIRKRIESVLED